MKRNIINQNETLLIKILDDKELEVFTYDFLQRELNGQVQYLQPTLESLVKRGLLSRIEKGKYCRHNFRNEYVIGNFLAPGGAVAYWSALNLHGLTNQFPNTVFVQTPKLKLNKTVFGVDYHFVKVKPAKATCYERTGYGNNTFWITNIEKTIVDCFDLPAYNGGYPELISALKNAKLNSQKLIGAARAVDNIAVIKRLGYLIELLERKNLSQFIAFALSCVNDKYNVIDPQTNERGDFNAKWRLRLNVSEQDILAMSRNDY
jgi:predicted transcriptional regulator of viral defense system